MYVLAVDEIPNSFSLFSLRRLAPNRNCIFALYNCFAVTRYVLIMFNIKYTFLDTQMYSIESILTPVCFIIVSIFNVSSPVLVNC